MRPSLLPRAARVVTRKLQSAPATRGFASKKKNDIPSMLFGISDFLGKQSDNLIPSDKERNPTSEEIPDFVPEDVKKDMKGLGLDSIEDLDELEEKNTTGFNDLGLVPPEGTGTFASPILIPSRRASRIVGYEDPESHAMFWFTIHNDDNTYYIKDLGLFFKLLSIPSDHEESEHH